MKTFDSGIVEQIPRLRRYARALCQSVHAADDLVQDTLERALRKKTLWQTGSHLRPWLFTIMHNIFVNQVRYQGRQSMTLELDENLRDASAGPESLMYAQQLRNSIGNLPGEQKEVFLLVSLEGFAYEEVATIMNVPVGTVMSRLSRAREKLRQQLTNENRVPLRRVK